MSISADLALLGFFGALSAAGGGLTSLGFGVACFADGHRDATCAVLTVVVPLITLPLALGMAILSAIWRGWLTSDPTEEAGSSHKALGESGDAPYG